MSTGLLCLSCEAGQHSACWGVACSCTHIICAPRRSSRGTQPLLIEEVQLIDTTWLEYRGSEVNTHGEEREDD